MGGTRFAAPKGVLSMTDVAIGAGRGHVQRRIGRGLLWVVGILAVVLLAGAPMAYMLWPRWNEPVAPDAPSLPIIVGGVTFNVPPAAIRVRMQRRPGVQPRIDLAFLWPSLAPPDPAARITPATPPNVSERLFLTIAGSDSTLPPLERLKVIYPRYTNAEIVRPDRLALRMFRAGTPYQGEDLIYDPAAPERFLLRCTNRIGAAPGMCLHERRISTADVTVRFPRDWLADWRGVADGIDRVIASLRPSGG